MHLLRDYAKSLTFVALTLVGYTVLMLSFSKAGEAHREFHLDSHLEKMDSKTESKAETQIHASLHSHTEASIQTAVAPEIETH